MSIKIITGVPGSGKSFYAVKEVITKHFEWSDKINEWVNLTDVTIISNIVGLKLPHIRFDPYLKENNIDYKKFFTSNYFKKILIPKYKKVVILLDEAQKLFPYSFRDIKGAENDPEELSNFYFFEFHRHLSTDIYLIGQLWTRFSPNIVNLSEYQIDAQRRTLSILGEFKYFFSNGFEVYFTKTIKPDKKIFALYKSTETEENKGDQIRPIRRQAIIVSVLLLVCSFAAYNFYSILSTPNLSSDGSQYESDRISIVRPDSVDQKAAGVGRVETAAAIPRQRDIEPSTRIKLGGMWFGDRLVGIEFFGAVVAVADFTYSFTADFKKHEVVAIIPDSILSQLKRVQTGDFYKDKDEGYKKIGAFVDTEPRTGRATHFVDDGKTGALPLKKPSSY